LVLLIRRTVRPRGYASDLHSLRPRWKTVLNTLLLHHPSHSGLQFPQKLVYGFRSLRPCVGQGASLGEEAVFADSGWDSEITARVGAGESLAFLNVLRGLSHFISDVRYSKSCRARRHIWKDGQAGSWDFPAMGLASDGVVACYRCS
jgi:hypothetical protein